MKFDMHIPAWQCPNPPGGAGEVCHLWLPCLTLSGATSICIIAGDSVYDVLSTSSNWNPFRQKSQSHIHCNSSHYKSCISIYPNKRLLNLALSPLQISSPWQPGHWSPRWPITSSRPDHRSPKRRSTSSQPGHLSPRKRIVSPQLEHQFSRRWSVSLRHDK